VLNCCVTETRLIPRSSNLPIKRAKSTQRPAEPVHLVYQYTVNLTGIDVDQQSSERRTFQVCSRVPSVVILLGQHSPARLTLAQYISLRRFALGIEGAELQRQTFLG